jgi:hypothetical protein
LPHIGRKGDQPEKKRGLILVDRPIKVHEDPIPTLHHLSGYLSIAGFIGIPEIPSSQIDDIKKKAKP